MELERHADIDVHVFHTDVDLIADRFAGNVIEVHAIDGIINAGAESDNSAIDETAHLIGQGGFEFVRDNIGNDVSKVGLIEGYRMKRAILLLGEVGFIHSPQVIKPRNLVNCFFQLFCHRSKIYFARSRHVGTVFEQFSIAMVREGRDETFMSYVPQLHEVAPDFAFIFWLLWYCQSKQSAQAATSRPIILGFAFRDLPYVNSLLQFPHRWLAKLKTRHRAAQAQKGPTHNRPTGPDDERRAVPSQGAHGGRATGQSQPRTTPRHTRPLPHPSLAHIPATMRSPLSKIFWGKQFRQQIISTPLLFL